MTTVNVMRFAKQNFHDGTNKNKKGELCPVLRKCTHLVGGARAVPPPRLPYPLGSLSLFKSLEEQMARTVGNVSCLFGVNPL